MSDPGGSVRAAKRVQTLVKTRTVDSINSLGRREASITDLMESGCHTVGRAMRAEARLFGKSRASLAEPLELVSIRTDESARLLPTPDADTG